MTDFEFFTARGFIEEDGRMTKFYVDVPAKISVERRFGKSEFVCRYEYSMGYRFAGALFTAHLMIYKETKEDIINAIENLNERIKNAQQ